MKELKTIVHLGRVSSNQEDDYVHIQIQDETSRLQVGEIKFSLAEFANLLTNHHVPADMKFNDSPNIGKRKETWDLVIDVEDEPHTEYGCQQESPEWCAFIQTAVDKVRGDLGPEWEIDFSSATSNHHKESYVDGRKARRMFVRRYV